jgi:hypothetical protein
MEIFTWILRKGFIRAIVVIFATKVNTSPREPVGESLFLGKHFRELGRILSGGIHLPVGRGPHGDIRLGHYRSFRGPVIASL